MKNPNYADSFNDWQSLLKLKTSQVSVAQNRLLKVVISTKRAQSLCRVTPPPLPPMVGGGNHLRPYRSWYAPLSLVMVGVFVL